MKAFLALILSLILLSFSSNLLALQPFFDKNKSTLYAPKKPKLNDFDREILKLCGQWGENVKAVDFETMMASDNNKKVVKRLRQALGNRILGKPKNDKEFIHQLRRVWFEQKGFQHVFCGEPNSYNLGGFHYVARYWQAQENNWAGYRKLNKNINKRPIKQCQKFYLKEQIKPPIYSLSIQYQIPGSSKKRVKCLSGYNREMNAEAILIAGTRAFKQANKRVGKNSKEACLYKSQQKNIGNHYSQMVIKQRALRTFYPIADKRPYCRKNKKDIKACLCSKL